MLFLASMTRKFDSHNTKMRFGVKKLGRAGEKKIDLAEKVALSQLFTNSVTPHSSSIINKKK